MLRTINLRSRGHTEKISDKAENDRGTKTDLKRAAQNSDNVLAFSPSIKSQFHQKSAPRRLFARRAASMVPGARVTLTGLKNASFNGKRAVIQPKDEWPPHESRIAVKLESGDTDENTSIAVKPQNLVLASEEVTSSCCFICLEEGTAAMPLLQPGCGCRGTAGHVHELCAIRAAAAEHERAGTWAGKHPWQLCATCKLPFTGALKLALAQEWCRRTAPLAPTDVQRFAARTTMSNALSAAGRLAEAETVVRGNLEAATALHGAEHRHPNLTLIATLTLTPTLSLTRCGAPAHARHDAQPRPAPRRPGTLALALTLTLTLALT